LNGWYTSSSGGTKTGDAGDFYRPSSSITLYAQWTQGSGTTYTVTFDANGGSSVFPLTVDAGDFFMLPFTTRSGYTLNGWYTSSSGGTKAGNAGASYTPSSSVTLYAQWTQTAPGTVAISTITLTSNEAGFRITWGSVSGAASYKILRSASQYGSYSTIATGKTDTTYDDTSVSMSSVGNSYFYRIVATNTAGVDSSQSTPKGVTIKAPSVRGFCTRTDNSSIRQGCLGIDDMNYFTSIAGSNGTTTLYTSWHTITPGTHGVYTARSTSTSTAWNPAGIDRGTYVFKVFHIYRISISTGTVTDDGVELVVE
jgi:uncharacterized repeat protein (TIGR02543 family)